MRDGAHARLRRDGAALIALSIVYLATAASVRNSYYQLILSLVPIWAVMGLAWNLISGYSGLVSFGHAAFFGAGAYTVTLALVYWHLTPWLGIPLAMIVGGIAAVLIGLPTFRLRGHYFALSMLAYPLAMVQPARGARPDFVLLLSTNAGDDKMLADTFAEYGMPASRLPLIGNGGHWGSPELLKRRAPTSCRACWWVWPIGRTRISRSCRGALSRVLAKSGSVMIRSSPMATSWRWPPRWRRRARPIAKRSPMRSAIWT